MYGPNVKRVQIVIDRRKPEMILRSGNGDSKRSAGTRRGRINLKLRDKLAMTCELDQKVRRVGVGIDRITICGDQVPIRSKKQAERAVQMSIVSISDFPGATVGGPVSGIRDGEDLVVAAT
jgi:hypothetical protein